MLKRLVPLLLVALPLFADRTLSWDEVAVQARLDAQGRLHVHEAQTYVFDGEWNGGERVFRIEPGQELRFEGLSRKNPDESLTPFEEGSLDEVGHYQFTGAKTMRWRSRLPSDPPYRNERLTFVLHYTLANILLRRGDRFRLDHDFAFPERSGEIRKLTVDLELDPAWSPRDLPRHLEASSLRPGRSFVVEGDLDFLGVGGPAARSDRRAMRLAFASLVGMAILLLGLGAYRRERDLGRFAPLTTAAITREWIEEHLLPIRAEVAGAAWDESVGASEVAALLARWSAEGKMTSTPLSEKEMELRLNEPRQSFDGYERTLLDKLFFEGDVTSTAALRAEYRQSGFQPSQLISPQLLVDAQNLTKSSEPAPPVSGVPPLLLFLASAGLFAAGFVAGRDEPVLQIIAIVVLVFCWICGVALAAHWRGRVDYNLPRAIRFAIPLAIGAGLAVFVLQRRGLAWPFYPGFACAAVMIANSTFNAAKSRRGRGAMAFRKRLASVRDYFARQLETSRPALDDRWFPYVIAFGLDDEANRWVRDFGGRSDSAISISSSSPTGGSSSPSWSGGGGAFGGAGATGSWAAAATGIASGVASASSSSGGGGGGGSSGGGGGGGW